MSDKQIVEWFLFPDTQPPKTEWYYTTLKRTEGDKITLFESREYYDSKENDWTDMEYDITYPIEYNNIRCTVELNNFENCYNLHHNHPFFLQINLVFLY
jgi:hypothetical protein